MSDRAVEEQEGGPANQLSVLHSQQHLTAKCCPAAGRVLSSNIPPLEAAGRG